MTEIVSGGPVVSGDLAPCNFFWGSHGCHLPLGDHTVHRCGDEDGPCSEYDEDRQLVRFAEWDDTDETFYAWGEWVGTVPGWRQ